MAHSLSDFPITDRWPAQHPDRLQLYSLPTPNGVKVSIMLEEIGLPYEVHKIDFGQQDQHSDAFLSLNPNGKIPAILDPDGPGGEPLALFESGAILQYLGEKTGKLLPADPAERWHALPQGFKRTMLAGIVGFRMPISRIEGKLKISQNRPANDRANIRAAQQSGSQDEQSLAAWMQRLGI